MNKPCGVAWRCGMFPAVVGRCGATIGPAGRVLRLHAPLRSESATAVRERIAAKGDWRQLLPGPVADYVAEHGLYGLRTA